MRIVLSFNELKDRQAGLRSSVEGLPIQQFTFQGGDETLAHGIVETVAERNPWRVAPQLPGSVFRRPARYIDRLDPSDGWLLLGDAVGWPLKGNPRPVQCVDGWPWPTRPSDGSQTSTTTARYNEPSQVGYKWYQSLTSDWALQRCNRASPDPAYAGRRTVRAWCKTIDSRIATWCIENEHNLLHNDSNFDGHSH